MKAGRELDALIAEKVMGWKETSLSYKDVPYASPWLNTWVDEEGTAQANAMFWSPSTQIADAWLVKERVMEREDVVGFHLEQLAGREKPCVAFQIVTDNWAGVIQWIYGDTTAEAICLAALKAHEED